MVGVINGLYANSIGKGGIVPIQIYNNYTGSDEKFTLKLTGSQGKVMKESVICAFTTALHQLNHDKRKSIATEFPFGFHIHAPSGATPKDGPSAGCAFTTAFISRMINKRIKNNIAMTGEIELTGKVTKIGGLLYKLSGARKAGVNLALIPKENEEDYQKILNDNPEFVSDTFNVITVDNIREILKHVLLDYDENDFADDNDICTDKTDKVLNDIVITA